MKPLFSFCVTVAVYVSLTTACAAESTRPGWCNNNLNPQERMICITPALAQLDVTMAAIYNTIRAGSTRQHSGFLKSTQEAWFSYRVSCGTNAVCVTHRYKNRINELTGAQAAFVDERILAERNVQLRTYKSPELRTIFADRSYVVTNTTTGRSEKFKANGEPEFVVMQMQIDDPDSLRETLTRVETRLYGIAQPIVDGENPGLYDNLLNGLDQEQRIDMHIQVFGGR